MAALNRALTLVTDALFAPLAGLPPSAGIAVLSLLTAALVLLAFKWTSDQRALAAVKRSIGAAIFEMRLFNDDLVSLFRAQADVLRHTLRYLRLSLVPTLWIILPVVVLMLHMEFHFGYTGLHVGEAALVKVELEGGSGAAGSRRPDPRAIVLEAPPQVRVETPPVVLPSANEIVWRIRPRERGRYDLRVTMDGQVLTKSVRVSEAVARRSPLRPRSGGLPQLLHPSEPPVPRSAGIAAIVVSYPPRQFEAAGWSFSWEYLYLGLTLAFAVALRRPFSVTI